MKVISFDIGIKNMAYCILSVSTNNVNPVIIHDWNVINMIQTDVINVPICTCMINGKSKKTPSKQCTTKAVYKKGDEFFCTRHAKSNKKWMIPTPKQSVSYIKKLKVDELISICNSHMLLVNINMSTLRKAGMIELLNTFYSKQCFENIVVSKQKNANQIDLIQIGKNMKKLMNPLLDKENDITHVLIENQISPIANRMKTVQGMLAQYFIMKNDDIHIEFVSSSHKLRQFSDICIPEPVTDTTPALKNNKTNPDYKIHKNDGIQFCKKILQNNSGLSLWKDVLNTTKKDDLADSFLQGLWYFKHRNIILYADDLNIKLV
jgi:hypothetical protein